MINKRHKERVHITIDIVQHQSCSACDGLFDLQDGRGVTEKQIQRRLVQRNLYPPMSFSGLSRGEILYVIQRFSLLENW